MTLQETSNLRFSGVLKDRVGAAVALTTFAIANEPAETPNHAARQQWVKKTIASPSAMTESILWAVCVHPAIQAAGADATDADIMAAVEMAVTLGAELL